MACLIPLRAESGLLGLVIIASDQENAFTEEQLATLVALVDYTSMALQMAHVIRELRENTKLPSAQLGRETEQATLTSEFTWKIKSIIDTLAPQTREIVPMDLISASLQQTLIKVDDRQAEILRRCAIPRWFDQDTLALLRERDNGNEHIFNRLCRYSFVRHIDDKTCAYHDAVRSALLHEWCTQRSDDFGTINHRLADHFEKRATALLQQARTSFPNSFPSDWRYLQHEALYHRLLADTQLGMAHLEAAFGQAEAAHDLAEAEALLQIASDVAIDRNIQLPIESLWGRLEYDIQNNKKLVPSMAEEEDKGGHRTVAPDDSKPLDTAGQSTMAQDVPNPLLRVTTDKQISLLKKAAKDLYTIVKEMANFKSDMYVPAAIPSGADGYELFRRAIVDRDDEAWAAIDNDYRPVLLGWAHRVSGRASIDKQSE